MLQETASDSTCSLNWTFANWDMHTSGDTQRLSQGIPGKDSFKGIKFRASSFLKLIYLKNALPVIIIHPSLLSFCFYNRKVHISPSGSVLLGCTKLRKTSAKQKDNLKYYTDDDTTNGFHNWATSRIAILCFQSFAFNRTEGKT